MTIPKEAFWGICNVEFVDANSMRLKGVEVWESRSHGNALLPLRLQEGWNIPCVSLIVDVVNPCGFTPKVGDRMRLTRIGSDGSTSDYRGGVLYSERMIDTFKAVEVERVVFSAARGFVVDQSAASQPAASVAGGQPPPRLEGNVDAINARVTFCHADEPHACRELPVSSWNIQQNTDVVESLSVRVLRRTHSFDVTLRIRMNNDEDRRKCPAPGDMVYMSMDSESGPSLRLQGYVYNCDFNTHLTNGACVSTELELRIHAETASNMAGVFGGMRAAPGYAVMSLSRSAQLLMLGNDLRSDGHAEAAARIEESIPRKHREELLRLVQETGAADLGAVADAAGR